MKTSDLIKIAMFPALMAATAGIRIPMVGAPITLQTMFVLMAGYILGKNDGAISMLIYLLLGLVGLPVFSGFTSGLFVLAGPTGGFLLSFPIAAYVVGYLKEHTNNNYLIGLLATLIIYLVGIPWLSIYLGISLPAAATMMLVYIPGDVLKVVASVIISKRVKAGI